jgi:hypothetical protein
MIWTFPPQRATPILERLEWLTDVLPSHNGKEQRLRQRGNPRWGFEFASAAGDDAARAGLENALIAAQSSVVDLPIWSDAVDLAAPLSAGATIIPVATANRGFTVGGRVAILHGTVAEAATIGTINADSLIVPPLASAWPAGATVAPLFAARMQQDIGSNNPWPAVLQAKFQFRCEAGAAITPASESADYLGHPVIVPVDWALDGNTQFRRALDEFDSSLGQRALYDRSGVLATSRAYRIVLPSRQAIADYRAWLAARAGRLNPTWVASSQRDILPAATIGAADTAITITNIGYAGLGSPPVGRRDIMLETLAGARYYRRITAAVAIDAGTEQITLDSPLGGAIAPASIAQVCFLRLSRLGADAVEIAHHYEGVAESRITLDSLRDDV